MKYKKTIKSIFKSRPNRFIAIVNIDGKDETVHVKNTGRCKELLIPGSSVILSISDNPSRKTRYDLIAVYKQGLGLVNIDSQAPNQVVKEWLLSQDYDNICSEYKYGSSRIDFYLEKGHRKILMEVKGCTLEVDGTGYFPDAPTERGTRHLRELAKAVSEGYECFVVFVIQMPKVTEVRPNAATDPQFANALNEAIAAGVKVICLQCIVTEDELKIKTGDGSVSYNKLVRDKIVEIIEASGKICKAFRLSDEDYIKMLDEKLNEECNEYQDSKNIEELADILEVVYAIAKARGYSIEQLEAMRVKKAAKRGGFEKKIFLQEVWEE